MTEVQSAAGSALRGSRHLRRAWDDVSPSSVPGLQAEAAQLRRRLQMAKAEVEQKHLAWSKGLPEQSARQELETARLEVYELRSELLDAPESSMRELVELQRKLQDTTEAWATLSAKNSELAQQLQGQGSCSLEYLDQVVSRYESRISELSCQLSRKCDEVVSLKEKLSMQEVQLQKCLAEPPKNLANALEFEEQLSASHERRNSQLSEQLAAKRQEVAILKEHLQTKSEELKLALKAREEPPTDALAQLRAELASEQSASEVWKAQEARVAAQVTELSSSLEREKSSGVASGKLLRRAQLDCQEMWASMEERKEEARRLQVVQQRLSDLRSKEEEMTCSWRQAQARAAELELALEQHHAATVRVVQEHELQRRTLETRSSELVAELFEERQSLEDMASRLAVERSCELAAAERAEQLAAAEQGVQELELATQEAWQALEEEAKAMGERLELAEQFTEGYERRNSELAEQLTGKRKELASLKARMISKALEHEEAIESVETEAREAARAASGQLAAAEATAASQQQELLQLRSGDLRQAQLAQSEAQQLRLRLEALREGAATATELGEELGLAREELRQSRERARAGDNELAEMRDALERIQRRESEEACERGMAAESRDEALGKLATLSLELQASQSRGHQLENQLARQLRELDPTLGSDHRGVSVQHLSNALVELVFAAGLTLEASLETVEVKVLASFSEGSTCPRDQRPGACYVDCIHGPDHAGPASHLLSASGEDRLGEVLGALEAYCKQQGLNPLQTYVWHRSFCANLHRRQQALAPRVADFRRRGSKLGKVVVLMVPWDKPRCLSVLSGLCELWHALQLQEQGGAEVELVLPPRASQKLQQDLLLGEHVMCAAWKSLQGSWLEDALAEHETPELWEALGCGLNLFKADRCLTCQLQSWLASTLERHLRAAQLEPSKASRLYDACGWLLWACERPSADMLREAMALGGHVELRKALGDLEAFQLPNSIFESAEAERPCVASLLTYVALLKSEQGDVGGCLAPLLRAQRIRKLTGTLETAAGVALCRAIGLTLEELGDFERAFEAYEAAQQLRRRTGCLEAPPLRSEHVVPKLEAEKQAKCWEQGTASTSLRSDTASNPFL